MRRQVPIAHQLYAYLFPNPTSNDPTTFSAHLARNLVPEVRIEVAIFYGDLNSVEARYPGLNYCHPPHRMRLGRFKHHRRLFEAFDTLGLTYNEVQDFCCWEGTKWARERYEKDEGMKVEDTTGNDIGPFVDRRELRAANETRRQSITKKIDISVIVEEASSLPSIRQQPIEEQNEEMNDVEPDEGPHRNESEETPQEEAARQEHIAELNRRRSQAVNHQVINQQIIAAVEQGHTLPPEVEQYLKEQSERGTLDRDLQVMFERSSYIRRSTAVSSSASATTAPRAAA